MAAPRNRRHIIVPGEPRGEKYRRHGQRMNPPKPPAPASRPAHGAALKRSIERAAEEATERRQAADQAGITVHGAVPGLYVEFTSQPGVPLNLESLEYAPSGIELVAVTESQTIDAKPKRIQHATVFVPDGKVKHFVSRFEKYASTRPKKKREPRHEAMLDPVASLRLATLRALWTDSAEAYPQDDETIWWEVWLRRHDGDELSRLMEFASVQKLDVSARRLQFEDRIVTLVKATTRQLASSIDVLNDMAELQRAKETAAVFVDMEPREQTDWAKELRDRTTPADGDAPAACILDTGITRAHPLLEAAVAPDDCTAVDPTWGPHDDGGGPLMVGHGTEMAGLALYGDLASALEGSGPVRLQHRLESVKILPPKGANKPELYGTITAEAANRAEAQAPKRGRCFAVAITAMDERDRGQPTSWSSAVDALAAGRVFDQTTQGLVYLDEDDDGPVERRLFVLSAGNVDGHALATDHLERSDTEPVHDPAQAWNALTVGAYTERVSIRDPSWEGWKPVAAAGDLSPWSTTSVTFAKQWPLKPDVVFEGGNVVHNDKGEISFPCADLCLLSTYYKPAEKPFVVSYATSAATAQAARMAAVIKAQYPELCPESVRGLLVHSAEWTRTMQANFGKAAGKRKRQMLVRRYGFGVPSLARALRSANDSLTLIAQASIRPFGPSQTDPKRRTMGEIQFFELPWPSEVLRSLGEQSVRLRVTLSYFIEPNPGRRGWKKRHGYASHGLRFDVKGPTESLDEFRKRLNQQALDEEEQKPSAEDSDDWYLGPEARNHGSIHSDILTGLAVELAERGVVGVYPIGGWWKEQPKRDRSDKGARYSLIVSIQTEAEDVDIWTPVANEVGVPIATDVEV